MKRCAEADGVKRKKQKVESRMQNANTVSFNLLKGFPKGRVVKHGNFVIINYYGITTGN
jgi:hypothetical protein